MTKTTYDDFFRGKMKLPKIGTKVKLRIGIQKAEFMGHIMIPTVRKGTIGEVTKISYPIMGGVYEPHVHVTFPSFPSGYELEKPLTSCIHGIPMTFSDWFVKISSP